MVRGQLAESIGRYLQRAIEPRTKILERDGCGQLDERGFVEIATQLFEHLIGHFDRTAAHLIRIAQGGFFRRREKFARLVVSNRREFLEAQSRLSAAGRVDIHSERTSDELSGAQAHNSFERIRNTLGKFKAEVGDQEAKRNRGPTRE